MRSRAMRNMGSMVRKSRGDDGSSLVEMALVCAFVYLPLLFGIFQVSYGIYVYNFVCNVAHQASRYAAVRGSNSCVVQSNFVDCNLNPAGSTNPVPGAGTALEKLVKQYNTLAIDSSKLTVTATWYKQSFTAPSGTGFSSADWTSSCGNTATCTVAGVSVGNSNDIGNAVEVVVTYNFPIAIPFVNNRTLPITGISKMLISE